MSLKDPKKIEENDQFAVFKGSDGHELKIFKKGLSEKLRNELSALPIHSYKGVDTEKMMSSPEDVLPKEPDKFDEAIDRWQQSGPNSNPRVEGEKARAGKEANDDLIKDVASNIAGGPGGWKRASTPPTPAPDVSQALSQGPMSQPPPVAPAGPATQGLAAAAGQAQPQAPVVTEEMPPDGLFSQPRQPAQQQAPQRDPVVERNEYVNKTANEENSAAAAWANDLANQHVSPKTYGELFDNASTVGKIGTLFGLLVSGAGSGLSGQPNMVMEMMNKEIERDLDAQKKSKDNAQNFLRINQTALMNQATMARMEFEKQLLGAQTAGARVDIKFKEAQLRDWEEENGFTPKDINAKATVRAGTQMRIGVADALQRAVDKYPVGPQRVQAQQMADAAKAEVANYVQKSNLGLANTLADDPEAAFQKRQRKLRSRAMIGMPGGEAIAQNETERHVPGFGDASIPVRPEIRNELVGGMEFDKAARDYVDFARRNWKNFANLNLIERQKIANEGKVKAANLSAAYRKATNGGQFKLGEQDFIDSVIPGNATSWRAAFEQIPKVEENIKHMGMRRDNTARSVGLESPVFWKGHYYQRGSGGKPVRVD